MSCVQSGDRRASLNPVPGLAEPRCPVKKNMFKLICHLNSSEKRISSLLHSLTKPVERLTREPASTVHRGTRCLCRLGPSRPLGCKVGEWFSARSCTILAPSKYGKCLLSGKGPRLDLRAVFPEVLEGSFLKTWTLWAIGPQPAPSQTQTSRCHGYMRILLQCARNPRAGCDNSRATPPSSPGAGRPGAEDQIFGVFVCLYFIWCAVSFVMLHFMQQLVQHTNIRLKQKEK